MPMTTSNNTKSDGGLLPKTVVLPSSDGELTNMPTTAINTKTTANNTKGDGGLLPKTVVLPSSDGQLTDMPTTAINTKTTANNTKGDGGLLPKTVVLPSSDGQLTNGTPKLKNKIVNARRELRIVRKIAEGGFGETYVGVWNSKAVCVKKAKNAEFEESLSNEHDIMQLCEHENILRSLCLIKDGVDLFLVLPLLHTDALRWTYSDDWDFDKSKLFSVQLMSGLTYMHQNQLSHNDIKPENCLINQTQDNLLIADFGVSCSLSSDDFLDGKPRGTLCFFAPEQLLYDAKQCHSSDTWSAALTIFVFVTRNSFFLDENPLTRLDQNFINERIESQKLPNSVQRALIGGLQVSLRVRRSCEEILEVLKEEKPKIRLKKMRLADQISVTNEGRRKGGNLLNFFKNNFATENVTSWTNEIKKLIKRLLRYISIPIREEHFEVFEDFAASEAFSVTVVHDVMNPIKVRHNLAEVEVNDSRVEHIINQLVLGMAKMIATLNDDSITKIENQIHSAYKQNF